MNRRHDGGGGIVYGDLKTRCGHAPIVAISLAPPPLGAEEFANWAVSGLHRPHPPRGITELTQRGTGGRFMPLGKTFYVLRFHRTADAWPACGFFAHPKKSTTWRKTPFRRLFHSCPSFLSSDRCPVHLGPSSMIFGTSEKGGDFKGQASRKETEDAEIRFAKVETQSLRRSGPGLPGMVENGAVSRSGTRSIPRSFPRVEIRNWIFWSAWRKRWTGRSATSQKVCGVIATRRNRMRPARFRDLSVEALAAHESGRYEDMLGVTRRMRLAASTPREHAITCNREVGAWDGLGRYPRALEASQEGLSIGCPDPDVQAMLQANLANAHYTLWHLIEAKAVARDLIERLEADPTRSEPMRVALGMAHYVRGHVARRQLDSEPARQSRLAHEAGEHLRRSVEIHLDLDAEFSNPSYSGIANTSKGGLLEVDVALGRADPLITIQNITHELEQVIDPKDASLRGDLLESWGWWSIFGCNIALRHPRTDRGPPAHGDSHQQGERDRRCPRQLVIARTGLHVGELSSATNRRSDRPGARLVPRRRGDSNHQRNHGPFSRFPGRRMANSRRCTHLRPHQLKKGGLQ